MAAARLCRYQRSMRRERDPVEAFLWGEVLLFALLGAALALFLTTPALRTSYHLPELKVVLATRLRPDERPGRGPDGDALRGRGTARSTCFLCCGFFTTAASWLAFSIVPAVAEERGGRTELWAAIVGRLLGAAADRRRAARPRPRAPPAVRARQRAGRGGRGARRRLGARRARSASGCRASIRAWAHAVPTSLIGANAVAALLSLLAVIGFSGRYRKHRQDLDRWLALGSTLLLAASLHYIFTPLRRGRRRLAGRLHERARLRRPARRRLAGDPQLGVRARRRRGARPGRPRDPRRARAVPVRRRDARLDARGRRRSRPRRSRS